jgi:DNA-binding XRE family transcriptional regulator
MQELTKKRGTEKVEARFVGKPEDILRFRRLAKEYHLLDVTDLKGSVGDEEATRPYSVEEVFPELLENRAGVAIRGYRTREGLTQKKLAEMTGISQHHISEMENGKCSIGKERAKKLASALNCDYRRFL